MGFFAACYHSCVGSTPPPSNRAEADAFFAAENKKHAIIEIVLSSLCLIAIICGALAYKGVIPGVPRYSAEFLMYFSAIPLACNLIIIALTVAKLNPCG